MWNFLNSIRDRQWAIPEFTTHLNKAAIQNPLSTILPPKTFHMHRADKPLAYEFTKQGKI